MASLSGSSASPVLQSPTTVLTRDLSSTATPVPPLATTPSSSASSPAAPTTTANESEPAVSDRWSRNVIIALASAIRINPYISEVWFDLQEGDSNHLRANSRRPHERAARRDIDLDLDLNNAAADGLNPRAVPRYPERAALSRVRSGLWLCGEKAKSGCERKRKRGSQREVLYAERGEDRTTPKCGEPQN
ncbi:hypothetical protein ONZ51_g8732 [Trametes cubensis]|uniref:Uncharacterized protein n=1 Tax=Trametes cubensis TaxID=1111947 RepID=A0AAD7X907_9APHY|nr:hypothetical protein ONZ51_g8732 [Trametes cubensis]